MSKTDLIRSIQTWLEGDEQAFTPVFYYYHSKLVQFSERFISDTQLSEELVMNVLLKIWRAKDRITNATTFNAYIYSAMRNELISSLRAAKKMPVPLEAVVQEPFIYSDYEYNAVTDHYRTCVEKLPHRRKRIFLMSLEEGLTYPQIAEKLHISVNTVQKQATAAIQAIRAELEQYYSDNPATVSPMALLTLCTLVEISLC